MDARGSDAVIVASYTRTAAAELAGRDSPLAKERIGTLHAHAYRALEGPTIAETKTAEFNTWAQDHGSDYALSCDKGDKAVDLDEAAVDVSFAKETDALLAEYSRYRSMMLPREMWPREEVLVFARDWEKWKEATGYRDFTDLIEMALKYTTEAPGAPSVGFFDEAQDFAPLQLALVRKWARSMDFAVVAFDDDQTLFSFTGADPKALLSPELPANQNIILSQSYRVPRKIHAVSQKWIERCSYRQPKVYLPRPVEGVARRMRGATYKAPEQAIEDALRQIEMDVELPDGSTRKRTVMFLTSCAYMLDPIKAALRARGVPYHNPFRVKRGDWNPLAAKASGRGAAARLLGYLSHHPDLGGRVWSPRLLQLWTEALKVKGVLLPGAREALKLAGKDSHDFESYGPILDKYLTEDALAHGMDCDLEWFESHLRAESAKGMEFPLAVVRQRSVTALRDKPRCIVGTIHSVKGGECDACYLFPDMSQAGYGEWVKPGPAQDSVLRQFYVGMTRAREELIVCSPAGGYAVDL